MENKIVVSNKVTKEDRKFDSFQELKEANIFHEGDLIQIQCALYNGDNWECEFFTVYISGL